MKRNRTGPATRLIWTDFVIDAYSKILDISIGGEPAKLINAIEIFSCALLAIGMADDKQYMEETDKLDGRKEQDILQARRGSPSNTINVSELNSILVKYAIRKFRLTSLFLSRCGIAAEKELDLELDEGLEDIE